MGSQWRTLVLAGLFAFLAKIMTERLLKLEVVPTGFVVELKKLKHEIR